jgi:hypothetical protein
VARKRSSLTIGGHFLSAICDPPVITYGDCRWDSGSCLTGLDRQMFDDNMIKANGPYQLPTGDAGDKCHSQHVAFHLSQVLPDGRPCQEE